MSDTLERLRQAVAKEEGGYEGFPVSFERGDLRALLDIAEAAQALAQVAMLTHFTGYQQTFWTVQRVQLNALREALASLDAAGGAER